MTTSVQEAVYRMSVVGADQVDRAAKSVDNLGRAEASLSVETEKLGRAHRSSTAELERLQAKIDPSVRAMQAYQKTIDQVQRLEADGIATRQQSAQIIGLAEERLKRQTAAYDAAGVATGKFT